MMKIMHTRQAFTLAELLIALAILGVIATFTIPKILDSGSSSQFNAIAKEAISMVSGAYQNYKLNSTPDANTSFSDLTPFMNYVKVHTVEIDGSFNGNTTSCIGNSSCILLHNGAVIRYKNNLAEAPFGGTGSTNAIFFGLDPDGKITTTGTPSTPGKKVRFFLFFNGRITDWEHIEQATNAQADWSPAPSTTPDWFNWSG